MDFKTPIAPRVSIAMRHIGVFHFDWCMDSMEVWRFMNSRAYILYRFLSLAIEHDASSELAHNYNQIVNRSKRIKPNSDYYELGTPRISLAHAESAATAFPKKLPRVSLRFVIIAASATFEGSNASDMSDSGWRARNAS